MKKNGFKVLALAAALQLAAPSAHAVVIDLYAGASVGFGQAAITIPSAISSDLEKPAQSYAVALGVDVPFIRVEGEYNFLNSKYSDLHAGMLNAYLKLFPTPFVKPYVGAGIGTVFGGTIGDDQEVDMETGVAYQGMLGLQFDIPATPVFIDIEGRVFYAPGVYEFPIINEDVRFAHYDIRAKIRYVF